MVGFSVRVLSMGNEAWRPLSSSDSAWLYGIGLSLALASDGG